MGSDNGFDIISYQKGGAVSDSKRVEKWIPVTKKNHT